MAEEEIPENDPLRVPARESTTVLSDQTVAAADKGVHRDHEAEQDDDTAFQSPAGDTKPLEHMAPLVTPDEEPEKKPTKAKE
jgi:hypothetical protein